MKQQYRIRAAAVFLVLSISVHAQIPDARTLPNSVTAAQVAEYEEAKRTFNGFETESAAEFVKIKNYHEGLVTDGLSTHQFHTADGKLIHCIEIGSQRSLKNAGRKSDEIRTSPEVLPQTERTSKGRNTANPADFGLDGTTDAEGNVRRCPKGSIPVVIPSLEDVCRFHTLDDIFQKYPRGTKQASSGTLLDQTKGNFPPPGPLDIESPTAVEHQYAHAAQTVDNQGEQAAFNVWQPSVERGDEFSLSQLWVARVSGSASNLQTVETGWQVCYNLYGDSLAHLFIYSTTHNYESGYPGGYNLSGMFIQTASSVVIGGAFSPVSTQGGAQYDVRLMFYRDPGGSHDWWLKYEDTWVGYYPNSYYNSTGIADKAAWIDYGGEIVNDNVGGVHTTTDMGSGRFPSEGWQHSAYIRNATYFDMSDVARNADGLVKSVTNASLYDLSLYFTADPNWGDYFFFGGPGRVTGNTTHDFNSDGTSDIIWQNKSTGQRYLWPMSGGQHAGNVDLGFVSTDWDIVGTGDFNGDGQVDILWQNHNSGQRYLWLFTGTQHTGNVDLGVVSTDWDIVGAGDFDGDGKADILWQNRNSGQRYLWLFTGTQHTGNVNLGVVSTDWDIVGIGDFNGDGRVDIVWQNRNSGQRYLWLFTGTQHTGNVDLGVVSTDWDIAGTGDFNGDGQMDIVWQNHNSGQRYLWPMTGMQHTGNVDLGFVSTDWSIRNH